jgi:hypothetical protein
MWTFEVPSTSYLFGRQSKKSGKTTKIGTKGRKKDFRTVNNVCSFFHLLEYKKIRAPSPLWSFETHHLSFTTHLWFCYSAQSLNNPQ